MAVPLSANALPLPTPYDPAADPPSSIDPMGTLAAAERLAEVILPGMTSRMWRVRFLTFSALASLVAERVVALMDGREDVRLEARLAFERIYVAAIIRAHAREPEEWREARRQLPGSDLARRAMQQDEPLTRNNFLKGQAVNGPFGVVATLAKQLEIVDDENQLARNGSKLILAWADDEGLPGVLDEDAWRNLLGHVWISDATKAVVASISKREWPGQGCRIWEQLARSLRSDRIRKSEKRVLVGLIEDNEIRRRVLEILRAEAQVFRETDDDRGGRERAVLLKAVKPALSTDGVDRTILSAVAAIDAYETGAALFQQAFDTLVWGLKNRGGRAQPEALLGDSRSERNLRATAAALRRALAAMDSAGMRMANNPRLNQTEIMEPLSRMREETVAAVDSPKALVETVMSRHERVQKEKRKGTWIERGAIWTLNPGFGIGGDAPPRYDGVYLHPFRIANAYSLLAGLGKVSVRVADGEA